MKNLYTKNEFLNRDEILNEGFFQFLGKMFNKVKTQINKVKGGNQVEEIYQKYLKIINSEFEKQAGVVLHLGAEEQLNTQQGQQQQQQGQGGQQKPEHPDQRQQQQQTTQKQPEKQNAGYSFYDVDMLNEAVGDSTDAAPIKQQQQEQGVGEQKPPTGEQKPEKEKPADANTKMSVATLKQKQQALQKILDLYQGKALKEMDLVLQKMGGAEKNPKLKIIIDNKKDQFKLDYLNAEIKFLEKSGDKGTANKIAVERNKLAKSLDTRWNLDKPAGAEQTQNTEIDINGKKLKLNTPYQYNAGGVSKTIMITGKSDDPQKVKAQYVSDKLGKTIEQDFRANLVKTDFTPMINQKYKYFSKKQNNIIEVEVLSEPDKRGLVKVKTDKGNILVQPGALMSAKKAEPQKAEAAPEKQTAAAQTPPAQPAPEQPAPKTKKVKATTEPVKQ